VQDSSRKPSLPLVFKAILTDLHHLWKFEPINLILINCNPRWSEGWRTRGSLF